MSHFLLSLRLNVLENLNIKRQVCIVLLALCTVSGVMAQKWEFGGLAGASGYMGDLNPENPFAFNDWSAGAFAKYNFSNTWGVRANVQYLNIWEADVDSKNDWFREQRQLAFYSPLWEFSAIGEFNFFNIYQCTRGKKFWQPYVFAGLGYTYYNPKMNYNGEPVSLRDVRTEGQGYTNLVTGEINPAPYDKFTFAVPFGLGLKYKPRGSWVYGVELGYRATFTDYLDDVSGVYPDIARMNVPAGDIFRMFTLSNPSRQPAGTMRGDGNPRDSYMFVGVRVSYILFNQGCPTW